MGAIELIVFLLAAWRLTVLFLHDTGPFGFIEKFRSNIGADAVYEEAGELGRLFQCPYCLSIWVGIAMYAGVSLVPDIAWPIAYILAASSAVVLIEEIR